MPNALRLIATFVFNYLSDRFIKLKDWLSRRKKQCYAFNIAGKLDMII
jgi:hypothetical protein